MPVGELKCRLEFRQFFYLAPQSILLTELLEFESAPGCFQQPVNQGGVRREQGRHVVAEFVGALIVSGREETQRAFVALGGIPGSSHQMLKPGRHFL